MSPKFAHIQIEIGLSEAVEAEEVTAIFKKIKEVVEAKDPRNKYCLLTELSVNLKDV
jgi:hypothetical protein